MQVLVKKSILDQLLNQLVEERSFHSRKYDQIAGDDKPVLPDAQMAMQLSKSGEPVNDPDFLPVNKQQLSNAASQLAMTVEPAKIQKFYSGLKKLIRKTGEKNQYKGMSETDLMERLAPIIKKLVKESYDDESEDNEDLATSGFSKPPPQVPKRKTADVGSTEDLASPDLVKALLDKISGGAQRSIASSTREQERRIRIDTGKARPGDVMPGEEPLKGEPTIDEPGSVHRINVKPPKPAVLDDSTKGDGFNLIAYLHKNNKEIPSSYSELIRLYPDFKIEFDIADKEIKDLKIKEDYLKVVFILDGKRVNFGNDRNRIDGREYSLVNEKLPFTKKQYIDSFSRTYQDAYDFFQKDQGVEEVPAEFATGEKEEEEEEPTADEIYYSGLEDYSKESGIPVGTLRNLGSDLNTIFSDNIVDQIQVEIVQYIYESIFVERADDIGVSTYFPLDYEEFIRQPVFKENENLREDVVEIIDSVVKLYMKSGEFEDSFNEFYKLREFAKSGKELGVEDLFPSDYQLFTDEELTQTEKRLGLRDVNSAKRFSLGFALTAIEISLECLKYLANVSDLSELPLLGVNLSPKVKRIMDEKKKLFGDDLLDALEEIKKIPHFARYFDVTNLEELKRSFDSATAGVLSVKPKKKGEDTQLDSLIKKIVESSKNISIKL